MDSDVLIKITKASIKDLIVSAFEVVVPFEVKNETVEQGKAGGYPDALTIEENVMKGKLKVGGGGGAITTEKLIASLNLLGGEAGSLRLFKRGGYRAIASDDSRFVDLLESLGIAYLTPAALLISLLRQKQISTNETRQYLEKLKPFISSDEYLASLEALRQES